MANETKVETANSSSIKHRNRIALLTMLYEGKPATKQDIAKKINLSLPTISENLAALEKQGLVVRAQLQESTGGRKPQTFTFNAQHFLAIGVAMRRTELIIQAVDLHGNIAIRRRRQLPFHNDAAYYRNVGRLVNEFATKAEESGSHILGIALTMEGSSAMFGQQQSVNTDGTSRTMSLNIISQATSHRCILVRNDEAEAMVELWHDPTIDNAAYLSVGSTVNAAVIVNGTLQRRANAMHTGDVGHMTLVRDGLICACGNRGCVNAYCALPALPEEGESLPGFFSVLEQGEIHHRHRMNEWFDNLTQTIVNMRTIMPMDIIIGGQAARFLTDDDVATLFSRVNAAEHTLPEDEAFRMRRGLHADEQEVLGAALVLVKEYVDHPYKVCL